MLQAFVFMLREWPVIWKLKINLVSFLQNLKGHHHKTTPNSDMGQISAEAGTRLSVQRGESSPVNKQGQKERM